MTADAGAVLFMLAAVCVARPSVAHLAFRRIGRRSSPGPAPQRRPAGARRPLPAVAACGLAALAVALLAPPPVGIVAAPVTFVVARRILRRLSLREERPPPPRLLATAADLLAACLEAGAIPATALTVTGECLPGAIGVQLVEAGRSLSEGAALERALPEAGILAPLAAVFRRSSQTGSAMTEQLAAVAEQLRADDYADRLESARRAGVLATLPLGVCMLPAFLLLAVVPAIVGLGTGLLR